MVFGHVDNFYNREAILHHYTIDPMNNIIVDGWMDGWEGGWMDTGMDGWMDGWMNGWMDGAVCDSTRAATGLSKR